MVDLKSTKTMKNNIFSILGDLMTDKKQEQKPKESSVKDKEQIHPQASESAKTQEQAQTQKSEKQSQDSQIQELTNLLKRVQADFENYRKRIEKEKAEYSTFASKAVIAKLLPILDSFELAFKNTENPKEFVKGVELIYAELWDTLEREGVKKIDALGKSFDPCRHEALLQEASDKPENTVIEELQKGYSLNNCILRTAKVKIASKRKLP